jgi:hypothetical protein
MCTSTCACVRMCTCSYHSTTVATILRDVMRRSNKFSSPFRSDHSATGHRKGKKWDFNYKSQTFELLKLQFRRDLRNTTHGKKNNVGGFERIFKRQQYFSMIYTTFKFGVSRPSHSKVPFENIVLSIKVSPKNNLMKNGPTVVTIEKEIH